MKELPFSKRKQLHNQIYSIEQFKSINENEAALQRQCEEYLNYLNIAYIRIPDYAYKVLFAERKLDIKIARIVASYLRGLPDLTILSPSGYFICIELKTKKGKLSKMQKKFSDRIPLFIIRNFEDFKDLIDKFDNFSGRASCWFDQFK